MQVIPATSDSNVGNADAIRNAFNFLKGFNQSEETFAGVAQNPSIYALLPVDTQMEINTRDAPRTLTVNVVDVNSTATGQVALYGCRITCHI